MRRICPFIFALLFGFPILFSGGETLGGQSAVSSGRRLMLPRWYRAKPGEMRGIWIATIRNMDFPRTTSPEQFQQVYRDCMRKIRSAGFNAVFFQIRPQSDAFYNSTIHPFSRFICGEEGKGFERFDLLGFMIAEAHRCGLQFHAWLNPYRIVDSTTLTKAQYLATLSPRNFARLHPETVLEVPNGFRRNLLLDPGQPLVRRHLLATVNEIIQRYSPDSIHFDDYFYPYNYHGTADLGACRRYNRDPHLSLEDWRRHNVNMLVREVSRLIRTVNLRKRKHIRFGISPFGIWRNRSASPLGSPTCGSESYSANYSDSRLWVKNRWVDYIVPQLYWPLSHAKAPYAALADWWAATVAGTTVKLYIGIGAHLAFHEQHPEELRNEILYNMLRREISGVVFFSCRQVFEPGSLRRRRAVNGVVSDCWRGRLPPLPRR